ncbi:low-specificity L-threonine aldolase [Nitrospina watsonii]|uniref:L-allo-threonine aldolase n=1 Tax=Nitrospina watsonii TaxID=1323948 RepID=A0ABM9HCN3_9BACT|nr:low-specificity L-threonine aldolase [Nitrospina watsonii]CAI2717970.1 L-allo-threonine aldolase [Nitrospina watsonii]
MEIIDYRSDTLTQPTEAMRRALAEAEVGDDVFDEDPTVHRLQALAAEKTGKPAALFVPSGTMGNLVSLLTHCQRGDEIILGQRSHIFVNEVGGLAALGGIHPHPIANREDGTLDLNQIEAAIRKADVHFPPTRLICLENTHNYCGGYPLTAEYMAQVRELADRHGLGIHLDGARIFNAAVALGVEVPALTRDADTVMFSLSKGLSAPVGSLVCGSKEWVLQARKWRKMVGGGMRQAGVLAAAGIEALTHHPDRLTQDHQNAQTLAQGLRATPGIHIDCDRVHTNILFFKLDHPAMGAQALLDYLNGKGIRILQLADGVFRAVVHRHITAEMVATTLKTLREVLK